MSTLLNQKIKYVFFLRLKDVFKIRFHSKIKFGIVIVFVLHNLLVCAQKINYNSFKLKGTITGQNGNFIYLSYYNKYKKHVRDSTKVLHDSFEFTGKITEPTLADIHLKNTKKNKDNFAFIFIEPATMAGDFKTNKLDEVVFNGSTTQKNFSKLNAKKATIKARYKVQIDSLSYINREEEMYAIRERLLPYFKETTQADILFFDQNPHSYATAYLLNIDGRDMSIDSLKMYYDRLGKKAQQSIFGQEVCKSIADLILGSKGSKAYIFSSVDDNGKLLKLSDFKGKYVLLDFWASWCIPCRKGNRHLRELFNKYNSKGVEFVSISQDNKTNTFVEWKKAITSDSLMLWRHILDTTISLHSDISKQYGISYLPTKILINPKGIIIDRFTIDKNLDKKFESLFKEN